MLSEPFLILQSPRPLHCSDLLFSPSDTLFSFILRSLSFSLPQQYIIIQYIYHGHIRSLYSGSDMRLFPTPSINHRSLRGAPYANQACHSNAIPSSEKITNHIALTLQYNSTPM